MTPQYIKETIVQIATSPGASLGVAEITREISAFSIHPTAMKIGGMTL